MKRCTLCDQVFGDTFDLARHLVAMHKGSLVRHDEAKENPFSGYLEYYPLTNDVVCWCDEWFHQVEGFAKHLDAEGGLDAHLLRLALLGE